MTKYAQVAIDAVKRCLQNKKLSPDNAWEHATTSIWKQGSASQKKGCPRNTFLGLCEEGKITGIDAGHYRKSSKDSKNKKYALSALNILKQDPSLANDKQLLWQRVLNGEIKRHNEQMDVVIALWNAGLLTSKANDFKHTSLKQ